MSSSNPEVLYALMNMERDPSGRVSAETLARVQSMLHGPASAASSGASGSVSFGHGAASVASSRASEGQTPSLGAEDSLDSLQAAMSRYAPAPLPGNKRFWAWLQPSRPHGPPAACKCCDLPCGWCCAGTASLLGTPLPWRPPLQPCRAAAAWPARPRPPPRRPRPAQGLGWASPCPLPPMVP